MVWEGWRTRLGNSKAEGAQAAGSPTKGHPREHCRVRTHHTTSLMTAHSSLVFMPFLEIQHSSKHLGALHHSPVAHVSWLQLGQILALPPKQPLLSCLNLGELIQPSSHSPEAMLELTPSRDCSQPGPQPSIVKGQCEVHSILLLRWFRSPAGDLNCPLLRPCFLRSPPEETPRTQVLVSGSAFSQHK